MEKRWAFAVLVVVLISGASAFAPIDNGISIGFAIQTLKEPLEKARESKGLLCKRLKS